MISQGPVASVVEGVMIFAGSFHECFVIESSAIRWA